LSRRISLRPPRPSRRALGGIRSTGGQLEWHPVRQFLVALFALTFFIAAYVWGPAVARLPILWLWLANVGLVGATC
jgi:hypothetical protein